MVNLDLLAKIERDVKSKKDEESRLSLSKSSPGSKSGGGSGNWLSRGAGASSSSSSSGSRANTSTVVGSIFIPYEKELQVLRLSDLVWAPHSSTRGGKYGVPFPGRLCNATEVATVSRIPNPIPEGHVVVEFFGMPKDHNFWWRFLLLPVEEVRPYHSPPPPKRSGSQSPPGSAQQQAVLSFITKDTGDDPKQRWNIDSSDKMLEALSEKFNKAEGRRLHGVMMKVAKNFLSAALDGEASKEEELALSRVPQDLNESKDADELRAKEAADAVAANDYFDRKHRVRQAGTVELRAGDFIRYTDKTLKHVVTTQIIEVRPHVHDWPILVGTGDAVWYKDVVRRYDADGQGGFIDNDDEDNTWELHEFKLIGGKAVGVKSAWANAQEKAKHGNAKLEKATGVVMNEGAASKRRRVGGE